MPRYTPEYCESLLAANPQACAGLYERIMRGKVIADVADHTTFVLSALKDGPKSGIQVAVWCRGNGDPVMEGELAKRICDRLVREGKAFKDGQVYSAAPAAATIDRTTSEVAEDADGCEEIAAAADFPTTSQEAAPIRRANASKKTDVRVVARRMQSGREASIWPDILEQCEKLDIGQSVNIEVPGGRFRNVFAQDIRNRLNASTTKQWLWTATQSDGAWTPQSEGPHDGPEVGVSCVIVTKRGLNPKFHGAETQVNDAVPINHTPLPGASPLSDALLAVVSHIDIKIAALQADRDRLIDMAQRFQEQV